MTAPLQSFGTSDEEPVRQPVGPIEENLLAQLRDVEDRIRQDPARRGGGPLTSIRIWSARTCPLGRLMWHTGERWVRGFDDRYRCPGTGPGSGASYL